jgi:hypothetical protein
MLLSVTRYQPDHSCYRFMHGLLVASVGDASHKEFMYK